MVIDEIDDVLTEPIINKINEAFVPLEYQHIYAIFNKVFPQEEKSVYADINSYIRQTILHFLEFDVSLIVFVKPYEYSMYSFQVYPNSIKNLLIHILSKKYKLIKKI